MSKTPFCIIRCYFDHLLVILSLLAIFPIALCNMAMAESLHSLDNLPHYHEIGNASGLPLNTTSIELLIHEQVNGRREQSGLKQLHVDPSLSSIARQHSTDMIRRNYFDHKSPDGLEPPDRYSEMHYRCGGKIGENIYFISQKPSINFTDGLIALLTMQGWMHSEGHSRNILYPGFQNEGIGVAANGTSVFVTQNFCTELE